MNPASEILPKQHVVSARWSAAGLRAAFADGVTVEVPVAEILPSGADSAVVVEPSTHPPFGVVVCSGTTREFLPWDWLRSFAVTT